MKRWDAALSDNREIPEADAFIADLVEVCRKHGLTLSHEDGHGGFEIINTQPDAGDIEWLEAASWIDVEALRAKRKVK
jgi:hypothetical protein